MVNTKDHFEIFMDEFSWEGEKADRSRIGLYMNKSYFMEMEDYAQKNGVSLNLLVHLLWNFYKNAQLNESLKKPGKESPELKKLKTAMKDKLMANVEKLIKDL